MSSGGASSGKGGEGSGAGNKADVAPDTVKPEPSWGAWVVIAGLVAVVVIFVVAVLHYKTAAEVTTAVGAVSGVIAALVGAYFGIRGATLAQGKVEAASAAREKRSGH